MDLAGLARYLIMALVDLVLGAWVSIHSSSRLPRVLGAICRVCEVDLAVQALVVVWSGHVLEARGHLLRAELC